MASLHALTNHSATTKKRIDSSMSIPVNQLAQHICQSTDYTQKWTYLIANHIRFIEKPRNSIRIGKPEQSELALWLEKIIVSGQCCTLFVEQLWLDEITFQRVKQLCTEHKVTLVNLTLNKTSQNNVIQGPW